MYQRIYIHKGLQDIQELVYYIRNSNNLNNPNKD